MLLRAIAIVVSVLLHVWTGNAMWLLLERDKLEAFSPGEGMHIVLEPPALVANEVANSGDSLASLHSLSAATAMPAPLRAEAIEAVDPGTSPPFPQEVVTITPQEQHVETPAPAIPEVLPDVIDSSDSKTAPQVAILQERKPPPGRNLPLPPSELDDVITSQHSQIDDTVPEADAAVLPGFPGEEVAPSRSVSTAELKPAEVRSPEVSEPELTAARRAPAPETFREPQLALAAKPVRPDEINQPEPAQSVRRIAPEDLQELSDRPSGPIARPKAPDTSREPLPPQALKSPEPNLLREPGIETTRQPQSPEPIAEQAPETIEVIAQPQQIVIVRELSSGQEKSGGDATQTGLYLGRINEQVQRAKVNPRSSMTGTTIVKFTVGLDGRLVSKEVTQSSGFPVLDDAAITALDRAAPFPPIPPDVSRTPMTFSQPFRFVVR